MKKNTLFFSFFNNHNFNKKVKI